MVVAGCCDFLLTKLCGLVIQYQKPKKEVEARSLA